MRITNNFKLSEFTCNDGSDTPEKLIPNIVELVFQLQALRDYYGLPVSINSGYRSKHYNDVVLPSKGYNTSKNSQHKLGKAADIVVKGVSPKEVSKTIEKLISEGKMKQGGLGTYKTFVHYDTRGHKVRW